MSAFAKVAINAKNFPDAAFRQYVSDEFDEDGDGVLSDEEISNVDDIEVEADIEDSKIIPITSLKGIEFFTDLTYLRCEGNELTALDVSKNTALMWTDCRQNFYSLNSDKLTDGTYQVNLNDYISDLSRVSVYHVKIMTAQQALLYSQRNLQS